MHLPPTIVCNVEASVILVVGGTDGPSEDCINILSEEAEVCKVNFHGIPKIALIIIFLIILSV